VTEAASAPRLAPPPVPLRTERLVLRHITAGDLDALRYYSDPEVCRYLPFPPADEEALASRVEAMAGRVAPSAPDEVLALAVVHGDTLVGDVMLRLRTRANEQSPPAVAEIGWCFAPSYAGRGLATEAATALITLAFDHYPLHRLYASLDPRNERSSALCERLGMTREAHLRRDFPEPDGTWTDNMVYGLLREEWSGG
jgi:RimJ/RimL family protein N-acetyltransferase